MIYNCIYVIFVIFQGKRIQLISTGVVYGRYKHGCMIEKEIKLSYLSFQFFWSYSNFLLKL